MVVVVVWLAALLAAAPAAAEWSDGPPLPEARSEVGVAADDARVYVVGGNGPQGPVNTLLIFDTATHTWRMGASVPGPARDHIGVAVVSGTLFAIGGLVAWPDQAIASVYAYSPQSDEWAPRAPLPRPRGAMGVAALANRIYAAGGLAGGNAVADFTVYDPATNQWTTLPAMPTARDHLMAGAIGNGFHAVGGRARDIGDATNAHEVFDAETQTWHALAPLPTPRGGGGAGVLFGKLYVFGGELPSGTLTVVEAFDPQTGAWETVPPLAHGRHGLGGAIIGNVLYAPAGGTAPGFSVSPHFELLAVERKPAPPACPTTDTADDDADGFTNAEERAAGSDPCDQAITPPPTEREPDEPNEPVDDPQEENVETEPTKRQTSREGRGCQSSGDGMNPSLVMAAALVLLMMRRPGP